MLAAAAFEGRGRRRAGVGSVGREERKGRGGRRSSWLEEKEGERSNRRV